jgi:hypothetical protein
VPQHTLTLQQPPPPPPRAGEDVTASTALPRDKGRQALWLQGCLTCRSLGHGPQVNVGGLFGAVPRDVEWTLEGGVDLFNANNQVGGRRLSTCQIASCRRALC